jgi:serine/threonine protein kinase
VVTRDDLAVKLLSEESAADEEARSRFIREVRLLQDDPDHENVIEVISRNLSASPPWFVMPLADSNLERCSSGMSGQG